ncbi:response regulator transcription factor [Pseudorhodoferax sp. Leaf274]|uniref:response regulator transcription factor n=1 Tax=Pseudorhodoferax sp. Leaf274 TaxID=1736318 RepID=UPI0009E782CC|nr:response regulator transcription factor [Pseudorhodoferax sp. Leaf274]
MDCFLGACAPIARPRVVLIVDDHPVMRKSLAQIIRSWGPHSIIHESGSVRSALEACAETVFDLVLLDLGLPDQSGIAALSHLRAFHQGTSVAVISEHEQPAIASQCLTMGAVAFVSKSAPFCQFERELQHLLDHCHGPMEHRAGQQTVGRYMLDKRFEGLTPRQLEVLEWLAKGYSNKRIAKQLGILPDTVKLHVSGIMKKFQVHSRGEVIARFSGLANAGWSGFQPEVSVLTKNP